MTDCKDELDEKECRVVEFPTQYQYKESLPPVGKENDGALARTEVVIEIVLDINTCPQVKVGVEVMEITDIAESDMKWGCKLQINLTWVEGRVRWRDLRDKNNLNMIHQDNPDQDARGQVLV